MCPKSDPLVEFPRLRLRMVFEDGSLLGPGKADLLELIAETGSISAAGRRMRMSYKRAWTLVETLNTMFREPLVESARGGSKGGGAHLSETGKAVLQAYRALEAKTVATAGEEISVLNGLRLDMSDGK